ncbi:hypothetical protein [Endozoicomonas sp. ONNA2]|uniref:hypothetical protein n=1 Tax=Endozoicomonas sp. ONNA2 TaxID=2828741 RepID=UPI0021490596|nr:hypothetical protein [Endozoicomonas sp. ONNA2]
MNESSAGTPPLDTLQNTQNSQWTCVSWFKKISDAVASKTSRFFGRVVAAVVSVVAFIPSLAIDLAYAAKSLYDRKITTHESTSLPWKRKIHDGFVRDTMTTHNQFLEKHLLHQPKDIPLAALEALNDAIEGGFPFELITPHDDVQTVKAHGWIRNGESRDYYDIGDGQALACNKCRHQFYDELMMNSYMEKLGIPTIEIKPAIMCWEFEGIKYRKATYITPSFNEYDKQNAFLAHKYPTHDEEERLKGIKLLPEDSNEKAVESWDEALKPLVKDVRTLIDHGLTAYNGVVNYAAPYTHKSIIVGKGNKFHSGGPADYEIRAFPYEFVNENAQLHQLPPKNRLSSEDERKTLQRYIESALWVHFNPNTAFLPAEYQSLAEKLAERHLRYEIKT